MAVSMCTVTLDLETLSTPVATGEWQIRYVNRTLDDDGINTTVKRRVASIAAPYPTVEVVQGAIVEFTEPVGGYRRTVTIPDATTANYSTDLTDIIPVPPDSSLLTDALTGAELGDDGSLIFTHYDGHTSDGGDLVAAVTAPTTTAFSTYAESKLASQPGALQQFSKRSKGGVIGTSGRGVVAIRFDHQLNPLHDTVWPVLRERQLVAGVGIVSRYPDGDPYSDGVTAATIQQMVLEGMEIWSHSATHFAMLADGYDRLVQEVVTSKSEIEALLPESVVKGWQQPGGFGGESSDVPGWANTLRTPADFDTLYGRLLLSTYGLVEAYFEDQTRRVLPADGCIGASHMTLEQMTLAQIKTQIDMVANNPRIGIELMLHSHYIDTSGYLSLDDFTSAMDYLAAARDGGTVEILTPSGIAFADPGRNDRLELVNNPTFDGLTEANIGDDPNWKALPSRVTAGSISIVNDSTGYDGSSAYVTLDTTAGYVSQPYNYLTDLGYQGQTFMIEAQVRAADDATCYLRAIDVDDSSRLSVIRNNISIGGDSEWHTVRFPFTPPASTSAVDIRCGRPGASTVAVDVGSLRAYIV